MFSHSSLHLRYFSPMSNRFTYSDRLLVCRGSNSFGNFLLCDHHNPKLPACPDSKWPNLYYLGVSLTVPAQTKATMIVLSGFILIISIASFQVTTFEIDQKNLRLVNNGTILSIHERWNKKYGTKLQHFIFVAVKIIQMELHVQNGALTLHVTLKWRDAGRYLWCDSVYKMSQYEILNLRGIVKDPTTILVKWDHGRCLSILAAAVTVTTQRLRENIYISQFYCFVIYCSLFRLVKMNAQIIQRRYNWNDPLSCILDLDLFRDNLCNNHWQNYPCSSPTLRTWIRRIRSY